MKVPSNSLLDTTVTIFKLNPFYSDSMPEWSRMRGSFSMLDPFPIEGNRSITTNGDRLDNHIKAARSLRSWKVKCEYLNTFQNADSAL